MRWWTFLIVAYLIVCVQFAQASVLQLGGWAPNLILILVVFLALHAATEPALVGCVLIGFMHDAITDQGLGTHPLIYGLLGLSVTQLRAIMYREHPFTHLTLGAMIGLAYILMLNLREWLRAFWLKEEETVFIATQLGGVLLTMLLAPVMIYFLRSIRKYFAFKQPQQSM